MKKIQFFLLVFILLGAFILRLYRFNNPIADWHSWRQVDTSAVSRNFVENGYDILHPRFDDLSNIPSGQDNPNGYRFVEFPLYNLAQSFVFKLTPFFTLEESGRLVSIVSSIFSCIFIFLLVKKYASVSAAFFATFFYSVLPYSIYYSRTILPDTTMVTASLGSIYFFDRFLEIDKKTGNFWFNYGVSLIFTSFAFLLKPYALFFTIPLFFLVLRKDRFSFWKKWEYWVFITLSLLPFIFWRLWMQQYPEGIPVNIWLFNGGNIRFKGSFFYYIFGDRIGKIILGYWGITLLGLGIIRTDLKKYWFFLSFLLSSLLYLFVIARGNVQHDYYQVLIIPTLTMFLGLGADFLIQKRNGFLSVKSCILLVVCIFFSLAFGWYTVRDYFNINNSSIIPTGEAVDKLTPKNAKIIAPLEGDTTLLYYTKRKGWTSFEKPLPEMVKLGADFLVLINPTKKDYNIEKEYPIVSATSQYILFKLSQ